MPLKLRAADIVIARCGAMTLSEIAVCKVASILIPSPNVTDNHQYKNGVFLERQKAVIMIEEKDLTEEKLISELTKLEASKDLRNSLGEKIFKTVKTDAANRISDILME
jgi:UDP-N-acetylglucosamine--N-acetylmuramyl-(pentapeptide) pyrophosphoryl-undecaprenol N-acetylglucosamine transferase